MDKGTSAHYRLLLAVSFVLSIMAFVFALVQHKRQTEYAEAVKSSILEDLAYRRQVEGSLQRELFSKREDQEFIKQLGQERGMIESLRKDLKDFQQQEEAYLRGVLGKQGIELQEILTRELEAHKDLLQGFVKEELAKQRSELSSFVEDELAKFDGSQRAATVSTIEENNRTLRTAVEERLAAFEEELTRSTDRSLTVHDERLTEQVSSEIERMKEQMRTPEQLAEEQ